MFKKMFVFFIFRFCFASLMSRKMTTKEILNLKNQRMPVGYVFLIKCTFCWFQMHFGE